MSDTSFVRTEMLPEQAPPATSIGVVGWIRANLFPNATNSILTVLALAFIVYVLAGLIPWVFQSESGYDSLSNCREVFFIEYGKTHGHACWSVISERWVQLLYGFYPADSYWRPNLSLALLIVALAPILFAERVPRALLLVTAAYPFIMPWLMWGGAFWTPLLVFAGIVLAYVLYRVLAPIGGTLVALPAAVLAALIFWLFLMSPISHSINKMVASPQLEEIAATNQGIVDTLTPQAEEFKAQLKEMNTEIVAGNKARVALFKELEAIEEELVEAGKTDKEVRKDPAFVEKAAEFTTFLDDLSALKAKERAAAREFGLLDSELSTASSLVSRLAVLEETEAKLGELEANLAAARKALPDKLVGILSEEQINILEIETTGEETQKFRDFLSAESSLLSAENLVRQTYADAGRIGLKPVSSRDFGGFMLAVLIGVVAIGVSLPIGIVLVLGR